MPHCAKSHSYPGAAGEAVVTRKKKGQGKQRKRSDPLYLAMLAAVTLALVSLIGGLVGAVKWIRLTQAVDEAAAASIGSSPTVATIVATRDAIRETAVEHGTPRAVVFAAIERRVKDDGQPRHVACFSLCAWYGHPEVEYPLPALLTATELEALRRERIEEHTGSDKRWAHHHH